jgi:uncharacterized protein
MSDDELRRTNESIVREYLDAINVWDFAKLRELLAEDAVFEMVFAPAGFDRRFEGRESILAFLKTMPALIDSENLHDIELDTLHSDPGRIVATYASEMVIKTTNLPYTNSYVTRWAVRHGKIEYLGQYYDPIPLVVALGGTVQPAPLEGQGAGEPRVTRP